MAAQNDTPSRQGNPGKADATDALAALQNFADAGGGGGAPADEGAENPLAALSQAAADMPPPMVPQEAPEILKAIPLEPESSLPNRLPEMPQPRVYGVPSASSVKTIAEQSPGALSASGFVSMLAKGNGGEGGEGGVPSPSRPDLGGGMPPPARPMPKAVGENEGSGAPVKSPRIGAVHEAREVEMAPLAPAAAPYAAPRRPVAARPVPGWYHAAFPVTLTLGSILMLIGMWAMIGSYARFTNKGGVPLVEPRPVVVDDTTGAESLRDMDFADEVPYIMLLCLPVALSLIGMGIYMKRRIMVAERG
jgi:hypothetical protein